MHKSLTHLFTMTKAFLGAIGILSCGLSALVSIGLCSAFGLAYGPMHPIIPCLLVGLGVDDMFVIVQAFNNVESLKKGAGTFLGALESNVLKS